MMHSFKTHNYNIVGKLALLKCQLQKIRFTTLVNYFKNKSNNMYKKKSVITLEGHNGDQYSNLLRNVRV